MKTLKHTPGPWILNTAYCHARGEHIIEIQSAGGFVADTKDEANARLIAAAPDLLEAARVAVEALLAEDVALRHASIHHLVGALLCLESAIRKAERGDSK